MVKFQAPVNRLVHIHWDPGSLGSVGSIAASDTSRVILDKSPSLPGP